MVSTHPELADYQEWEEIMENMEYIRELLNDLSCYSNAGHIKLELTDLSSYLSSIISSGARVTVGMNPFNLSNT